MDYAVLIETFRANNHIAPGDYNALPCGMGATRRTWVDKRRGDAFLTNYCFKNATLDQTGLVKGWQQVKACQERRHLSSGQVSYECIHS